MRTLQELKDKLNRLNMDIADVLEYSKYKDYDDLSGVDFSKSAEDLFLVEEYRMILDRLDWVNSELEYLKQPIREEGTLYLNDSGRYQIKGSNTYFASGYGIEFLIYDEFNDTYSWHTSTVEHNGTDYYIVHYKDVSLNGLKVRVRK